MNYKICTKCGKKLEATTEFFHKLRGGLRAACKVCVKEYDKIKHKEYYRNNKEKCNKSSKKYYEDNKERILAYYKEWKKDNQDKRNALHAKRKAQKLNQTPDNVDLEKIQLYYKTARELEGYEVDHIQPLSKGGLHHENNLQLLPWKLNNEKKAKWPLTKKEEIKYKGIRL